MKTKIFVHETQGKAEKAARILGLDPSVWKIVGAGGALYGFRADTIWVMPIEDSFRAPGKPKSMLDNYQRWINESLLCRLAPDGVIHYL